MTDNFLNGFYWACLAFGYSLLGSVAAGFFICRRLNRRSHTDAWYRVFCFVWFFLCCGSSGAWPRFDFYRWRDA